MEIRMKHYCLKCDDVIEVTFSSYISKEDILADFVTWFDAMEIAFTRHMELAHAPR